MSRAGGDSGGGGIRTSNNITIPENFILDATFTSSAADTPIHRCGDGNNSVGGSGDKGSLGLKSCLSSSSLRRVNTSSPVSTSIFSSCSSRDNGMSGRSGPSNEEFNLKSFGLINSCSTRAGAEGNKLLASVQLDAATTTSLPTKFDLKRGSGGVSTKLGTIPQNNRDSNTLLSSKFDLKRGLGGTTKLGTDIQRNAEVAANTPLSTKYEGIEVKRKVCFSQIHTREYESTVGDQVPESGAPLGLGWRYNPHEKRANLPNIDEEYLMVRKSADELKLSDEERHRRLSTNPNISAEDLRMALQATEEARRERKQSLSELLQLEAITGQFSKTGIILNSKHTHGS